MVSLARDECRWVVSSTRPTAPDQPTSAPAPTLPGLAKSTAGPPGTADAVLASDNDNPAAPNTGRVLLRRLRFEGCFASDIVGWGLPLLWQMFGTNNRMLGPYARQATTSQD